MKKIYRLEELDCAVCASKMEDAIRRLDGVESASVNFLTQKLTLEAPDDRFEEILQKTVKAIKRIEPDCRVIL